MDALLALLTRLLGEDHALVQTLTDAEPVADVAFDGATDDELAAIGAFGNVDDATIDEVMAALRDAAKDDDVDTATIAEAADAYKGLTFLKDVRAEAAAAEEAARAEALAAFGDEDDESGEDDAEEVEPTAEADDVEQTEEQPETVTASRPSIRNVAPRVPRPRVPLPSVEAATEQADAIALRLVDSIGGEFERGQIAGWDDVVSALSGKFAQFGGPASGFEKHPVATAKWLDRYPTEQTLGHDLANNESVIQAAVGNLGRTEVSALTAAICAPPEPIYEVPTLGTEARPVRDFLPAFGATRGGIIYRPGLSLTSAGTVNNNSSGVTSNWSDGDANKYVLSVACPSTETTSVYAQVARAEVSNMQGQFDPESVAAALRLQMVLWARAAEANLLDKIDAASSQVGPDNTAVIGFGRLFLERINNAATLIRSQERMDRDATLDVLVPFWVVNAAMDDYSFQQPGDGLVTQEIVAATIEGWLAARNVRVGWFLDDQLMPTQSFTPPSDLAGYPQNVEIYIFEPGHHLFLDGGELNLGIVRDSTLNNTNEYQTFMETFEGLAPRGVVSWAVNFNVCRSGTTGAGAEITCGEIS